MDFAYWWSFSGGASAINGATPSSSLNSLDFPINVLHDLISLGNMQKNLFSSFCFLFNITIPSCCCFSCYYEATVQVNELKRDIHLRPHSNVYEQYKMYRIPLQQLSHLVAGNMVLLITSLHGFAIIFLGLLIREQ